jgi:hypothetical protein
MSKVVVNLKVEMTVFAKDGDELDEKIGELGDVFDNQNVDGVAMVQVVEHDVLDYGDIED